MTGPAPSTTATATAAVDRGIMVCAYGFPVFDQPGMRPSLAMVTASTWVADTILRGTLAIPIADIAGLRPQAVADALDVFGAAGGATPAMAETLASIVDGLAADVPDVVAADVARQAFDLAFGLITNSAVDGVVAGGSSIRLPDDVRFLVNPGEADGLRPGQILAAAFRRTAFALSGLIEIASREALTPAVATLH